MLKVKLAEEVVDPDDIEMLEDLIVAATNEALRKVEEESGAAMSRLTADSAAVSGDVLEMDYYSNQISRESKSFPPSGDRKQVGTETGVPRDHMPVDQVEQLAKTIVDARNNVRYCKVCCTLTDRETCPICSNPDRDKKDYYGRGDTAGSGGV